MTSIYQKMIRYQLLCFLLLLSAEVWGQYSETIRTGRPGAAIGPFTVGKKVFQVQSGVNLGRTMDLANGTHATAVFRYGILERFELSALAGYSNIRYNGETALQPDRSGLSAAQVGFRVNIHDGGGKGPNIGFQSRLKLNVLDEDYHQPLLASVHMLILSQKLGEKVGVVGNLGISTKGSHDDDDKPSGIYVLNFNMPVGRKCSVFIENFGSFGNGLETRFDSGLGYLVTPDLQLDASIGYGKNHGIEDVFIDFGFSWRTIGKRE